MHRVRVVVDPAERVKILDCLHSGIGQDVKAKAQGGHIGVNNTLVKLRERYWWPRMVIDTREYIASCEACQKNKNQKIALQFKKELCPVSIPFGQPWSQIGIDLIGPLEATEDKYRYVLTGICYFTKFVELYPLKEKSALGIAECLYDMQCRYGVPRVHISDQGREFVNQVTRHLFEWCGVAHRITSSYHPQANGLVERQNRTTLGSIRKCIAEAEDEDGKRDLTAWKRMLPSIRMSINSARKGATGFTPYELMFTRKMRLPMDAIEQNGQELLDLEEVPDWSPEQVQGMEEAESDEAIRERVQLLYSRQQEMYKLAEQAQKKRTAAMKKAYDNKNKRGPSLKVGDEVLKENKKNHHRMGGKLDNRYNKVYTIVDRNEKKGTYTLQGLGDTKPLKNKVPGDQLKLYLPRPEHLSQESQQRTPSKSKYFKQGEETSSPPNSKFFQAQEDDSSSVSSDSPAPKRRKTTTAPKTKKAEGKLPPKRHPSNNSVAAVEFGFFSEQFQQFSMFGKEKMFQSDGEEDEAGKEKMFQADDEEGQESSDDNTLVPSPKQSPVKVVGSAPNLVPSPTSTPDQSRATSTPLKTPNTTPKTPRTPGSILKSARTPTSAHKHVSFKPQRGVKRLFDRVMEQEVHSTTSPQKTPQKTPKKTPQKSPSNTPLKTPLKSVHTPQKTHQKTPLKIQIVPRQSSTPGKTLNLPSAATYRYISPGISRAVHK